MNGDSITFKMLVDDKRWIVAQAAREGTSVGALVRRAIDAYRASVEPAPTPPTPQTTNTEEPTMPRPKKTSWNSQVTPKKTKFTADNPLPVELRVTPPKVVCPRCQTEVWATPDGEPKPHLRPSRPGDPAWSTDVPTMTDCR